MSDELKKSERYIFKQALEKIAAMDAEKDSTGGYNEWGEADCFNQARQIAQNALAEAKK